MRISDWSSDVCSSDLLRKALMSRFSQKFILVRRRRRMKSPIWQNITWPLMSSDEHCKARRGSGWEERDLAKVRSFFAFEAKFPLAGEIYFWLERKHTGEGQRVSGRFNIGGHLNLQ